MSFDVRSLGSILGVWAHPDDETFMMAGLMAVAAQSGQEVACITATKGEKGSQDEEKWPSSTLGEVRAQELQAAFSILGVKHHHWLGYPDGECRDVPQNEAVGKIITILEQYQPDTVITFPPDGLTGHHDHVAISSWTKLAVEQSGCSAQLYYALDSQETYDQYTKALDEQYNLYFNIDQPTLLPERDCDIVLQLDRDVADLKLRALAAMPSQTGVMISNVGNDLMYHIISTETYVLASRPITWGIPKP